MKSLEKPPIFPKLEELLTKCNRSTGMKSTILSSVMLISPDDSDVDESIRFLKQSQNANKNINSKLSRCFSCLISSSIGDALGCETEFLAFAQDEKKSYSIKSFKDLKGKRAEVGQWTDDTSMALCLADSLLKNKGKFDGIDIR